MLQGFTIRKSAAECSISTTTAFFWRHKVFDALQKMADTVKLDGIEETDETFFAVSYKGNHKKSSFVIPRAIHHRGHMTKLRGLSKEKVCVPCAVNRTGLSIARISNLARIKTAGLESVLSDRIESGSHIITDKASAYQKYASAHGLELILLKAGKSSVKTIYNLAHINNYHSELKRFMCNFKGVSSKYLNNYLVWHNFVNYSKESYTDKKKILLAFVLSTPLTVLNKNISVRLAIPLFA